MQKIALTFGLIAGLIITVLMLASMSLYMQDDNPDFRMGEILGYGSMIIALSMIFFGIRRYRDQQQGGRISFGKAFQVGLLITLVAAAIYVAAWMIYANLGPGQDFMEKYFQYSVEQLKGSGKSQEVIEREIAEMESFKEMYKNPLIQMGVTFLEIFPVGLLVTLISAFLLKKQG